MTVITMTIKNVGLQIKGDIQKYEHVREVIEEEKCVRLVVNKNWETIVSKDIFKIIAVEYEIK